MLLEGRMGFDSGACSLCLSVGTVLHFIYEGFSNGLQDDTAVSIAQVDLYYAVAV